MLCFLSTIGIDKRSFQGNLKKLKMLCSLPSVGVANRSFQSYLLKRCFTYWRLQLPELPLKIFPAPFSVLSISLRIVFAVSYTEPMETAQTKNLQNLCCQIEVSSIAEYFLIGKLQDFRQIRVRSLELPNTDVV